MDYAESTPRQLAETHASNRDMIRGQGLSLRRLLDHVGLREVGVQEGTEIRDATYFDDRITIGYVFDHNPLFVTILASSETSLPISPVYIAPTTDTSGLLADDASGTVWTDSFWIVEDGKFKHIKPSRPIPLDGLLYSESDGKQNPILAAQSTETAKRFDKIANSKFETKQVLAAAGVVVPRGIQIADLGSADIDSRLREFADTLPAGREIVFKPDDAARGEKVVMGNPSSSAFLDSVHAYSQELSGTGMAVNLEERIIPPPQSALAKLINAALKALDPDRRHRACKPDEVDYNFRIITTKDSNPQIIDAMIRYQPRSSEPVNINKGALFARVDVLKDPDLVEAVYATARQAVTAVYRHAHQDGDPEITPDYVGVDIIPDRNGENYVLEAQTIPGGFQRLASIYKRPLTSIRDVLIPAQITSLRDRFANRPQVNPERLRRLFPEELARTQFQSYIRLGDYSTAENKLYEIATTTASTDREDRENFLEAFGWLAERTGNYQLALQYVDRLLADEPDNSVYQESRDRFAALSQQRNRE